MNISHALVFLTLRASAPDVPLGVVMEFAVKGVQPMAGAINELIKALSEPFERTSVSLSAIVQFVLLHLRLFTAKPTVTIPRSIFGSR